MLNPQFVPPAYNDTCFAHLPATIKAVLTGQGKPAIPAAHFNGLPQRYNKVVFLFVDSFGWHFFEQYKDCFTRTATPNAKRTGHKNDRDVSLHHFGSRYHHSHRAAGC